MDIHSEYVIFIGFPLQQLLRERALMLNYRYVECLVYHSTIPSYRVVPSSAYIAVTTSHKNLTGYVHSRHTASYNAININLPQFSLKPITRRTDVDVSANGPTTYSNLFSH